MRARVRLGVALTVVGLLAAGCGQQETPSAGSGDAGGDGGKPVVGLIMKSLGNQFFQDMQKGAIEHANTRGDLELKSTGTQSETDIAGQEQAINNFVAQQVDAIVIAPADSRALIAPLKQAAAAGIKLVNIDVKLDDAALKEAGLTVPFVGPDNAEGARMVGEVLAKELGEGGKVVILEGVSGADNATQRKNGFMQAVEQGKLELIDSKTANWETDEANTVFTNMLTANPDIQGVMCSNDSMALGVVKAIESAGKKGQIKVVGFDNIPAIQPLVADGTVLATIDQFGSQQAAFGIDAALDLIASKPVQPWAKTRLELNPKAP
jgi:ribose transport system substrate-binding protein